jgi:ribokinase
VRLGVVGHVEWIEFVRVPRVPVQGEIVHALQTWTEPAGGGAVAAVQLLKLAGGADFFTALGEDELGRQAFAELSAMGIRMHVAWRAEPQRRGFTYVDDDGERTITVIGDRMVPRGADRLPWDELADLDGVYFTGGDATALRAARAARLLVATPRAQPVLAEAGVQLDALVGSGPDEAERYAAGDIEPQPSLVVRTAGASGGTSVPGGTFPAAPLPGPKVDAYGAGDSFAAGLTYALAAGYERGEALAFASRCGAAALTGRGAFAGQLRL